METQIVDNYRALINSQGFPMIILSNLESAFEPDHVNVTQTGLELSSKSQKISIRNMDADILAALRSKKHAFLAMSDIENQEFNYEKTITL